MGLSARERHVLDAIERKLAHSDPSLTSMLTRFNGWRPARRSRPGRRSTSPDGGPSPGRAAAAGTAGPVV